MSSLVDITEELKSPLNALEECGINPDGVSSNFMENFFKNDQKKQIDLLQSYPEHYSSSVIHDDGNERMPRRLLDTHQKISVKINQNEAREGLKIDEQTNELHEHLNHV